MSYVVTRSFLARLVLCVTPSFDGVVRMDRTSSECAVAVVRNILQSTGDPHFSAK